MMKMVTPSWQLHSSSLIHSFIFWWQAIHSFNQSLHTYLSVYRLPSSYSISQTHSSSHSVIITQKNCVVPPPPIITTISYELNEATASCQKKTHFYTNIRAYLYTHLLFSFPPYFYSINCMEVDKCIYLYHN